MNQDLLLETFYPHSPEQVWQALTERSILSVWMMDNNFEAHLGHQFQFQSHSCLGQKLTIYCEVLEIEAPKRLVYSWQESLTSQPSRVTWILTPVKGGTQVRLHHSLKTATSVFGSLIASGNRVNRAIMNYDSIPSIRGVHPSKSTSKVAKDSQQIAAVLNHQTNWHYWLEQKLAEKLRQLHR